MSLFVLIFISILFLAVVAIIFLFYKVIRQRSKSRSAAIDFYKTRSEFSIKQEIFDLYQSVFGSFNRAIRKSPVLLAAEHFKKKFKLGRFVIFCNERFTYVPLMSTGFKLKAIHPLKADYIKRLLRKDNSDEFPKLKHDAAVPISRALYGAIAKHSRLPAEMKNLLMFHFSFNNLQILFVGEDMENELVRYCTDTDFNRAIWPLFVDICRNNYNIRKQNDKIKTLQSELRKARNTLGDLNMKLKNRIIDLHSFYEISNKLFTLYDQERLIEKFIESIRTILQPVSVVVLMRNKKKDNIFTISYKNGNLSSKNLKLEITLGSDIYKLLASNNQALLLPVISSGLPEHDVFIETALVNGLSVIDKLYTGDEVQGFVLIGEKKNKGQYTEADLETFSTLVNIASLALGNIDQYKLIEKMSYTDSMTKLYNYRYFYKRLNEEIFRSKRFNRMLALVIFDIDNFKIFNDTYGHQAGDEVLKNMADLVTSSVRAIDVVSRYGGEEFCVIMPDTGFANCLIFIERLRKKIEANKFISKFVEEGYKISISIGGAIYPVDASSADRLIYCADMALLKAKTEGRNRSIMFNSSMIEEKELQKQSQKHLTDLRIREDI